MNAIRDELDKDISKEELAYFLKKNREAAGLLRSEVSRRLGTRQYYFYEAGKTMSTNLAEFLQSFRGVVKDEIRTRRETLA